MNFENNFIMLISELDFVPFPKPSTLKNNVELNYQFDEFFSV